jgi:hypothetical protein
MGAGRSARVTLIAASILLGAALAMHAWAVIARADREPHMDENEYLHAGWLMANGERLYETFFEHHSPFFFAALEPLAPEGELVDVRPYFIHARWLCGFFGLITLAALAALLWRVSPEAGAIAVALLLASGPMWLRGFAEVRAEAFALAFFWVGTWTAMRWRGPVGGIGIGLVAISCIWQPKWPVACAAVGVLWLVVATRKVAGIAVALATTAAGFAVLRLMVPFETWWFFNFEVNSALAHAVGTTQWVLDTYFEGGVPFLFVPDAFHPWLVLPAAALVAAAFAIDRNAWRILPVAVLLGAFLEMRLLYPWPAIWPHYYLMWGIAAAGTLGLVPSSLGIVLQRARVSAQLAATIPVAVTITTCIALLAHMLALAPTSSGGEATFWVSQKYIRERLQPGERIWLESQRHPISVRDAHYYWFSVGQMVAAARVLRQSERGRRFLAPIENFPTCTPASSRLRYTLDPRRVGVPGATECMDQLVTTGQARKTVFFDVWEIRLKSAPDSAPVKGNS